MTHYLSEIQIELGALVFYLAPSPSFRIAVPPEYLQLPLQSPWGVLYFSVGHLKAKSLKQSQWRKAIYAWPS